MDVNEYQLDVFPWLKVDKDDFKALTKVKVKIDIADTIFSCFSNCFQVMKSCWDIEPSDRPTFRDLANQLDAMQTDTHLI